MRKRLLPWGYLLQRLARSHGFIDPISLLGRLQRFAQPSEVAFPLELVRAGALFHARGLMNTKAIQHNLDWVWPYWVERQFDPEDESFIPRAFSVTHINMTHRNWTAVGLPGSDQYVVVDPNGLVMPHWDGWSVESWLLNEEEELLPSKLKGRLVGGAQERQDEDGQHKEGQHKEGQHKEGISQELIFNDELAVETTAQKGGLRLTSRVWVREDEGELSCVYRVMADASRPSLLVLTLRPYNGEGVSFVHDIQLQNDRRGWQIENGKTIAFGEAVEESFFSDYRRGDVYEQLKARVKELSQHPSSHFVALGAQCEVGLATAAAGFLVEGRRELTITLPLITLPLGQKKAARRPGKWRGIERCTLQIPEKKFSALWRSSLASLLLHAPEEVYPGPFTYKRFWFRDAAFLVEALLSLEYFAETERVLDTYPGRQTAAGYFLSQEGEWDSNGAALWSFWRYTAITHRAPKPEWREAIFKGARWIAQKRVKTPQRIGMFRRSPKNPSISLDERPLHEGLLPPGFSAEHLGTNDYYYWDDFWCAAGLFAASELAARYGDEEASAYFRREGEDLLQCVERSLAGSEYIAASPYRRLDAGAVGSLAASYPLAVWKENDPRLHRTVEFLLERCCVRGGFFQDMIHSGINPYLTLHLAQVLLRAGDPRFYPLMCTVSELASPTGQWPEAIHPRTLGGCMGDGQHAWASAEWLLMVKSCFVREEGEGLILLSGVQNEWLREGAPLALGPVATRFGRLSLSLTTEGVLTLTAEWHGAPPPLDVRLPGFTAVKITPEKLQLAEVSVTLQRRVV